MNIKEGQIGQKEAGMCVYVRECVCMCVCGESSKGRARTNNGENDGKQKIR